MSVFLFFAAMLGGGLNAVAGGGSFIALPALLYAGVAPVTANATAAVALWPGSISSAVAYRRNIKTSFAALAMLCGVSLIGGLIGALLLIRTSDTGFMRLLPWLMLLAAATVTFGGRLTAGWGGAAPGVSVLGILLQLVIAIYGGYFGGGMGIMMLATFSIAGMTDIHEMNGVKALLGVTINGVALVTFILYRAVTWAPALVMIAGAIVGGYGGAALARRVDPTFVRFFVVIVAWVITVYFFIG